MLRLINAAHHTKIAMLRSLSLAVLSFFITLTPQTVTAQDIVQDAIVQSPANAVTPGTPVTYTFRANSAEPFTLRVTDNGVDISAQLASQQCNFNGAFFCGGPGTDVSYSFTWTPSAGVHNLLFETSCLTSFAALRVFVDVCSLEKALITVVGTESLRLTMSASPSTYSKIGDVINYSFGIVNSGTIDLNSVEVNDSKLGVIDECRAQALTIENGINCSKSYTITQADIDARSVSTIAIASALGPDGITRVASEAELQIAYVPSSILLTITPTPTTYAKLGDVITYSYQITNSGINDLRMIALTDNRFGAISECNTEGLAPGNSVNCSREYTIVQADLDAGSVSNSAQVSAVNPAAETRHLTSAQSKISRESPSSAGENPDPANPDLTLTPNLSPNQREVARAVNGLCAQPTSNEVQSQCDNIFSLTTDQVRAALQELVPDEVAAQGMNAIDLSFTQFSNIKHRLAALHHAARNKSGRKRLTLNGLTLAYNDQFLPVSLLADAASDGSSDISVSSRWGGFLNGRVQVGDRDTTSNVAGFDFDTTGVTLGVDYLLSDRAAIGGALGYANTSNEFDAGQGELNTDAATISVYGNVYTTSSTYVDWIATYGSNAYDSKRQISYSGVNTQANGDTNGSELGVSLSIGSDVQSESWLFTSYVRAEYVDASIDSYSETGAQGLALAYDKQSVDSLVTAVAARIAKSISTRYGVYTPSFNVEWAQQYRDDQRLIIARFVENPTVAFNVATDKPDRNYFDVGVALAATWPGGRSAFVSYQTILGQQDLQQQSVDLGVRVEF